MIEILICLLCSLGSIVSPCATEEQLREQLKTEHNIDIKNTDIDGIDVGI